MSDLRLFVAVDIPERLKQAIAKGIGSCRRVAPDARWVRPENLHLTLKFLGATPQERIDDIAAALESVCGGHATMHMAMQGPVAFPDARRARVFWVGLGGDMEPLARLAQQIEDGMAELDFEREGRPFTGHITIARLRRPADVAHLMTCWEREPGIAGERFEVSETVLYSSELRGAGARYTPLRRIRMESGES
ncbi:MAG: RNA 2',3'-cyclic phosphodiesterase [Candidatus Geothermincolia bacterium]